MKKKMKNRGTQVPGPFATKWVVFIDSFLTTKNVWNMDFRVEKTEVINDCFTSLVLDIRKKFVLPKILFTYLGWYFSMAFLKKV